MANPKEVILLNPAKEIGEKIKNSRTIPNFTPISNAEKSQINHYRHSMECMLNPLDRERAFWDFIELIKFSNDKIK